MVPDTFRYTSTHEWCKIEGDIATLGLTEFALRNLQDIIYIELPDAGDDVLIEVPFGEIEGMEAVKDLISPFDGIVQEINARLVQNPDILVKDPYGEGWLIRLKVEGTGRGGDLLSAAEYDHLVRRRK